MLRFLTAGESHGPSLSVIVEGLPAGLAIGVEEIADELARRRLGYGRGPRMRFERDELRLIGGVRHGRTLGSPVAVEILNSEWPKWEEEMSAAPGTPNQKQTKPRPGHADLAGMQKYAFDDARDVLERASARETAARVGAGALARSLLTQFNIEVFGFVRSVGPSVGQFQVTPDNWRQLRTARDESDVYCPDPTAGNQMRAFINDQKVAKDTAGGIVEAHVFGCPVGIGSCMTWDGRLDSRIAAAVVAIQAFKGVEFGLGFEATRRPGSQVHDEIDFDVAAQDRPTLGFVRGSNNAGGLEGGMTNGQSVVVRGAMKPISTLGKPLRSIDLNTKQPSEAGWERSDISAISAASVIMENVIAFEIARAFLEKFGGDSLTEVRANYDNFLATARRLPI